MKYALLSDLHANFHALEACLTHAGKQGVDRIAILGDLVGYGAYPAQVVERCQQLQAEGAIVVGVAVIVDRGAGALIEQAGLGYRAAYTLADLGL